MVVKAFFLIPKSAPVRICNTFVLVCMLTAVPAGVTEPRGLPPTAPAENVTLPKLATGSCVVPEVSESSMISSWSDAAPVPDFVSLKVWPVVRSATVAVVFVADVTIVDFITSPAKSALLPTVGAPSTTTAGAAAGFPPEHSMSTPAALNFGELVVPVTMTAVGPTPLVVLVQVSAGILNFAVTLRAPVGVNVHPPKLVLVAFATSANLAPVTRASPAAGPLRGKSRDCPAHRE